MTAPAENESFGYPSTIFFFARSSSTVGIMKKRNWERELRDCSAMQTYRINPIELLATSVASATFESICCRRAVIKVS